MSSECVIIRQQINLSLGKTTPVSILSFSLCLPDAPKCAQKTQSSPQFYTGLRRPINLTCFMHGANPSKLNFTWLLPNKKQRSGVYLNSTASYLTVLPNQLDEFGPVICRAQNELDLVGECRLNIMMGGKCVDILAISCAADFSFKVFRIRLSRVAIRMSMRHWPLTVKQDFIKAMKNSFVTCISDKRMAPSQNMPDWKVCFESVSSDTFISLSLSLLGNCAFILPDLQPERHHDFRVFTKNKFGDNFDKSYSITVGRPRSKRREDKEILTKHSILAETLAEKTRFYWPYMTLLVIGTCLLSLFIICCCCHHIRRSMYNKRKSKGNFDSQSFEMRVDFSIESVSLSLSC